MAQSQITTNTTGTAAGGIVFELSDLPNSSEFVALFDFYKITGISMKFIPRVTQNTSESRHFGNFYWIVDHDDANVPDFTEMEQKQGMRVKYSITKPFKIFFRPKILTNIWNGGAADAHMVGPQGWLNAANPSVPHYALKWVWNGTEESTMDVITRYYLKFKGVQ